VNKQQRAGSQLCSVFKWAEANSWEVMEQWLDFYRKTGYNERKNVSIYITGRDSKISRACMQTGAKEQL